MREIMGKRRGAMSKEAIHPIRCFSGRSGPMILLSAIFLFQACAEDLQLPPAEDGPAWEEVNIPLFAGGVYSMTRGAEGELIVGTRRYDTYGESWGAHIFISRDDGDSWRAGGGGLNPDRAISSLVCKDRRHLFAGMDGGGVFLARDGEADWKQMNNRLADIYITDLAIVPSGDILASTGHGVIYRSSDNARSWAVCDTLGSGSGVCDLFVSVQGTIYAACGGGGIYISGDSGATWNRTGPEYEEIGSVNCFVQDEVGAIFASTYNGVILKSGAPGMPWTVCYTDSLFSGINPVVIDGAGRIIGGLGRGGLIVSGDGGVTWERIGERDIRNHISSMIVTDESLFVGERYGDGELFRSRDQGGSWNVVGWHKHELTGLVIDDAGIMYISTQRGIYKSDDDGKTWASITGDINCFPGNAWIEIHPGGSLFYMGCRLFRSDDRDGTWTMADPLENRSVFSIDIDEAGTVFIGTDAGILCSPDGTAPFEMMEENIIYAGAILSAGNGLVFAANDSGAYLSVDNGASWKHTIEGTRVFSIDIDEAGNVYAASRDGMMISSDTCATWITVRFGGSLEFPFGVFVLPDSRVMTVTSHMRVYVSPIGGKEWTISDADLGEVKWNRFYIAPDGCLYYFGDGLKRLGAAGLDKL